MKTEDIIKVLDNAEQLWFEMQDAIREYVLDKNIPLKKRFRVWEQHCDKCTYLNADIDLSIKWRLLIKLYLSVSYIH